MARRLFLPVSAMAAVVCCGCATTHSRDALMADAQVSVRFVVSPAATAFTQASDGTTTSRLVADTMGGGMDDGAVWETSGSTETNPYHAVLWGGAFAGTDVTSAAVPMASGPYTFGLFDQDLGTAYQGWMTVNHSGDDLVSVLASWKDAVAAQKKWLGFDQRLSGAFSNPSHRPFKTFRKQLRNLNRLERRINRALVAEKKAVARRNETQSNFIASADVLLIPGSNDFFRPSTRPAFASAELAAIRDGQPTTKVVMIADYAATKEKLCRINELREDLERSRMVFVEEGKRLKRTKAYYAITNHLYNHDKKFVQLERRLQEVRGLIEQTDRQIVEHRHRTRALGFIAALFSPDEAADTFTNEMRGLQRQRVVLEEHQRRIDLKLASVPVKSPKRAEVQYDRQQCIARIEAIDKELGDITNAQVALATMKDTTSIIHRHGPTRVVTATLVDKTIPSYLVDAVEKASLMTIRLQAADSLYAPPVTTAAKDGPAKQTVKAGWFGATSVSH